jgi:hypothetical protein
MAARGVVPMVEKEGESEDLERLCQGGVSWIKFFSNTKNPTESRGRAG